MVESICIDAVPLYNAFEVPKFLEWCALRRDYNDDNDLVRY
jgi:hypothetical protein